VDLNPNNLGTPGPVGTITITNNGAKDVQVDLVMSSNYSVKIQDGADFNFNSSTGPLKVTIDGGTAGTTNYTGATATLNSGQNVDGLGTFRVDLMGIQCSSCPQGTPSVDQMLRDITGTGITAAFLTAPNSSGVSWAVRFCTASGGHCGPATGFAGKVLLFPSRVPGRSSQQASQ